MAHQIDLSYENRMNKIAVRNNSPEAISKLPEAKTNDISQLITNADKMVEGILGSRGKWEARQERLYKVRYGIRPPKTFPFIGASNLCIPIIDKTIRQTAPAFVSLIYGHGDLVQFKPVPTRQNREYINQVAELNKHYFNDMIKNRMDGTLKKVMLLVDKMLDHGRSVVKVTYDYQTEAKEYRLDIKELPLELQQFLVNNFINLGKDVPEAKAILSYIFQMALKEKGCEIDPNNKDDMAQVEKNIKRFRDGKIDDLVFEYNQVNKRAPLWSVCKMQDFIVHGAVNHIQEAHFICHRMWFTQYQLESFATQGKLKSSVVEKILEEKSKNKSLTGTPESSEAIALAQAKLSGSYHHTDKNDLYEIRECYLYASPNKGNLLRRCILTYCPSYKEEDLKFNLLHYDDNKWPFVSFEREIVDSGFLAPRGLSLMGDQIQAAVNIQHNQKVDAQTILNAPTFWYIPGQVNWNNQRFIPGQGIPVKSANSFGMVATGSHRLNSSIEEDRNLRSFWEMYVATPDSVTSDPTAPASSAKTATEVIKNDALRNMIHSQDSNLFLENAKELYEMTWAREMQFGDKERFLEITGQKNPIKWVKQYGLQRMQIRPIPSLSSMNTQFKIGQLQFLMQLAEHPIFGQMIKSHPVLKELMSSVLPEKYLDLLVDHEEWKTLVQQMSQQNSQSQMQSLMAAVKAKESEHKLRMDEINAKGDIDMKMEVLRSGIEAFKEKFGNEPQSETTQAQSEVVENE